MKKEVLPNGIRLVTEQMPHVRSVAFGIWVKTGSRFESSDYNGASHFIEHMLFKGTENYSTKEIAEIFDGLGGQVNAFTAKEYTCYYCKVLDEHLPIALDVLSEMIFKPQMAAEEVHKEQNVILEEILMVEDEPDDLVHELLAEAAYGNHPLAYPILGSADNIMSMSAERLNRYKSEHYVSDRIVISAVGKLDERCLDLIRQYFGSDQIKKGQPVHLERPVFQRGTVYKSKATEQNHLCLASPGLSQDDEQIYALALLNNAIGGNMSSRLFQEIRENRGLAYSVYSYHSAHEDSGLFTIYIGTAPQMTTEVLNVTYDIMEKITSQGLTENELHKGKEQLKGSLLLGLESTNNMMNRIGRAELMTGEHIDIETMIQRIEAVTLEGIKRLAVDMFSQGFATSLVGPEDDALRKFGRDSIDL